MACTFGGLILTLPLRQDSAVLILWGKGSLVIPLAQDENGRCYSIARQVGTIQQGRIKSYSNHLYKMCDIGQC